MEEKNKTELITIKKQTVQYLIQCFNSAAMMCGDLNIYEHEEMEKELDELSKDVEEIENEISKM